MSDLLSESKTINLAEFPFLKYDALFLIDLEEFENAIRPEDKIGKEYGTFQRLELEFDNFINNLLHFSSEYKNKNEDGIIVAWNCCETPFIEISNLSCPGTCKYWDELKEKLDERNVKTGLVAGLYTFRCVNHFCIKHSEEFDLTIISNLTYPNEGKTLEEERLEPRITLEIRNLNNHSQAVAVPSSGPNVFPQRICIGQLPYPTPILDSIMNC